MTLEDKFIISCKSWNEFWTQTKSPSLTRIEKGKRFERLTQLYLQALPTYQSKLSDVWLLSEVPTKVLHQIGLPKPDEGIDLIAKTRNGEYWAIQSKFTSDKDTALNRKKIGTFISLAFNTCKKSRGPFLRIRQISLYPNIGFSRKRSKLVWTHGASLMMSYLGEKPAGI